MPELKPRAERFLSDYRMHYQNPTFPLLSFMYAVLAGGEHTIYCDFTADFAKEYLFKPFGGSYDKCPPHVRQFVDQLVKLDVASKGRSVVVHATCADWEVFVKCLHLELTTNEGPTPAW
jgi:hypothetical protein